VQKELCGPAYCTLQSAHCTLHNKHCTPHSPHCTLHIVKCTLQPHGIQTSGRPSHSPRTASRRAPAVIMFTNRANNLYKPLFSRGLYMKLPKQSFTAEYLTIYIYIYIYILAWQTGFKGSYRVDLNLLLSGTHMWPLQTVLWTHSGHTAYSNMTSGREIKVVKKSVLGTAVVRKYRGVRVLRGMFVRTAGQERALQNCLLLIVRRQHRGGGLDRHIAVIWEINNHRSCSPHNPRLRKQL
jgi:hypothetical protein